MSQAIFLMNYSANGKVLFIESLYNKYQVYYNEDKGTGIYLELPGTSMSLIKTYEGKKFEQSIVYLMKKEMFI